MNPEGRRSSNAPIRPMASHRDQASFEGLLVAEAEAEADAEAAPWPSAELAWASEERRHGS